MSEDKGRNPKDAARKAREERLAAALRANLRRRKAGTRPAESEEPAGPEPLDSPGDDAK